MRHRLEPCGSIEVKKVAAMILMYLLTVGVAHAQTGSKKTPTALNAEINVSYADNHVGAVTPSVARQVTLDQNASVPFLLTTNIFSAYQAINLNGVSLPTPQSGTLLQGSAPATFAGRFEIDSFGASSHFSGVRANGTVGSPTALINGSEIVSLNAFGYNGLANVGPFAAFRCFADQTWASGSAAGTYCDIATTPDNSTTMASIVKFNNDGGVVVGAPTGADKGAGTVNATGVFVNGTPVSIGNSITALTGDVTATGPGSVAATLATVNSNTGSWGTATQAPQIAVNGKGLITSAANVTVTPAVGSITGLGTGVGAGLATAVNTNSGFPLYGVGGWTPTVTTTGTVGTPAYSVQVGTYEQIGRQVTVRFNVALSGWTGSPTGSVLIAGLPFTSANVANDIGICHFPTYAVTGLNASSILTAQINPNTVTMALGQVNSTATAAVTAVQAGTAPTLVGMCSYHT